MKFKFCTIIIFLLLLISGCTAFSNNFFYDVKDIYLNGIKLTEIDRLAFIKNFEDLSFKLRPTKDEEDLYKMYGSKVCEVVICYKNSSSKTLFLSKKQTKGEYNYYLEICSDKKYKICQISYEKYLFILKKSS